MVNSRFLQSLTVLRIETINSVIPKNVSDGGYQIIVWPMYKNNAQHIGRSYYNASDNPGGERWKYLTTCSLETVTPVIDNNGTIYISSENQGLHAIYPNGTRKWQRDLIGYDGGFTPAIGLDGTIYVGTLERFYAFYPNGTLRWIFPMENTFCGKTAIGPDGTVYTGTDDGCLYALYPNGTIKWEYHIDTYIIAISVDTAGNVYFTGRYDYQLYCLYPNGTLRWIFDTNQLLIDAPLIAEDGAIYIIAIHYLIAINQDGTEKWRIDSNGEGDSPSLAPDGTLIYAPYRWQEVFAINPVDGHTHWVYRVEGTRNYKTSPVISSDGTIYFAYTDSDSQDNKGYICALNPDGKLLWKTRLTTDIQYNGMSVGANPAIGADGTVYVTTWFRGASGTNYSDFGYVHAIGGGKIQTIDEGYLYLLGKKVMKTLFGKTIVIGDINVEMKFFHPEQLQKVEILIDGTVQCTLFSPPFKYSLDTRLLGRHNLELRGYYNDETTSIEKMDVFFLIL
jgi:hypothetical protein